ncbi:MAG: hypothetical protein ACFE9D_12045 [Promethearchaeota archaeon]
MRTIDIVCPLLLLAIALLITWILVLMNPVILPFALGFAVLLVIFILLSFCTGRYTRKDASDQVLTYKR